MEEKKIVIAERDNIAAVMEGKKVQEFYVTRGEILLGDIYLATVENILPSIEAAFVDVGSDKMGFLHAQDVIGKGALKDKLSPKQKLVVQVTKEPTGHKGPRVTTEISLPGRFLVLIPNETGINVSRKIENSKERARLKSVVSLLKPVGVGVIIRTEAEGQTEAEIQEDLEILLEKWNNIVAAADSMKPPALISRDQDLLYRVLREACTEETSEIVVDTAFALNRVQQLLQNWHMSKSIKTTLYKGTEPLLIATDIHKEIKAALNIKVNMPSGGYLFIQTTEALTVIDVNSGKFTSSATQDETIFQTNKEAVYEIARQLRLRNIGGMIIIDFIDMNSRLDKLAILEELELAMEKDKAKPQIGQISDLGLVELTRHRQGQSISELFSKKCPHCQGAGYIMEEFKFASPVAEGEQRVKAAKANIPMAGFRKNNNENDEGSEENKENRKNNFKNRKNNKFNKNKNKFNHNNGQNAEVQPVESQAEVVPEPVQPVIEEKPVVEKVAEEVKKEPKKRATRTRKTTSKKAEEPKAEVEVAEVEKKPKRSTKAKAEKEEVAEEKPKKRGRKPAAKKSTKTEEKDEK